MFGSGVQRSVIERVRALFRVFKSLNDAQARRRGVRVARDAARVDQRQDERVRGGVGGGSNNQGRAMSGKSEKMKDWVKA